jgi:hypothetical protein
VGSDLAYYASFGGTGSVSGNQWWSNAASAPSGFTAANPGFADPARGNFANQANGTLVLANGHVIPASSIGRNR